MQLTQGQHGLAIALCIERDGDAKASGIIVYVRPMLDLKQPRCLDAQEHHAVLIARAVRSDVDEAPATTGADIDLKGFALEALRREPLRDLCRIVPRLEHALLRRVDHARDHYFPVQ